MKSDASSLIKSERIQYCYRETCPVDVCVMAEIYVRFAPVNRLLNDWSFKVNPSFHLVQTVAQVVERRVFQCEEQ